MEDSWQWLREGSGIAQGAAMVPAQESLSRGGPAQVRGR